MSERGIQIEGNVFCPVCECYMSQEIICNRKNAEPQAFCILILRRLSDILVLLRKVRVSADAAERWTAAVFSDNDEGDRLCQRQMWYWVVSMVMKGKER